MFRQVLTVSIVCVALGLLASSSQAHAASSSPGSFQELVTEIQRMLTELGYRPGAVDGRMGERTRQAIRRYQSNTGLPVDGHPSRELHQHLRVTTGAAAPAASASDASSEAGGERTKRKAAWQGETVSDTLLRIAPSGASASKQRLATGTRIDVIRRQGAWLEVRLSDGGLEGWVKQVSVRALSDTAAAPSERKSGGFFAGLARGISRLLGGSSESPEEQGSVTVGIRGLTPEDLAGAIPDAGELDKMEEFRADQDQAYRFAAEEQLTTQTIEYLEGSGAGEQAPAFSGGRDD